MGLSKGVAAAALAAALLAAGAARPAYSQRPTTMKGCTACHEAKPDVVRGKLVSSSEKFRSVQVDVGPLVWIIKYDDSTALRGAASLAGVPKGKEMAVAFTGPVDGPVATSISFKQPFELPEDMLVGVEEMKRLVAGGPEKGGYLLVDSRPSDAYDSGHIPGAVSIPYPMLAKVRGEALPGDKGARIIFYCGGYT